jgi:hypothetical protein
MTCGVQPFSRSSSLSGSILPSLTGVSRYLRHCEPALSVAGWAKGSNLAIIQILPVGNYLFFFFLLEDDFHLLTCRRKTKYVRMPSIGPSFYQVPAAS